MEAFFNTAFAHKLRFGVKPGLPLVILKKAKGALEEDLDENEIALHSMTRVYDQFNMHPCFLREGFEQLDEMYFG